VRDESEGESEERGEREAGGARGAFYRPREEEGRLKKGRGGARATGH
jgi:hypothetical protein